MSRNNSAPSTPKLCPKNLHKPSDDEDVCSCSSSSRASSILRPMGCPKSQRGEVQPIKYKTQMCDYFLRQEACPYDPNCAFAHGDHELREESENLNIQAVTTLPRSLLVHEIWVQTTKFTCKTGPSTGPVLPAAPPMPSFMMKKAQPSKPLCYTHNPYAYKVLHSVQG